MISLRDLLLEDLITEGGINRFTPKDKSHPIFRKWEVDKSYNFDFRLIEDAIRYGMVLKIKYNGTERDIQPMVLGVSAKQNSLIRAFHVKGTSVSSGELNNSWRLFDVTKVKNIRFTGQFFRVLPKFYNADDSAMKNGIVLAADIDTIRSNQKDLIK